MSVVVVVVSFAAGGTCEACLPQDWQAVCASGGESIVAVSTSVMRSVMVDVLCAFVDLIKVSFVFDVNAWEAGQELELPRVPLADHHFIMSIRSRLMLQTINIIITVTTKTITPKGGSGWGSSER